MKKISSNLFILCGSLCIIAAFFLHANNTNIDNQGAEHCATVTQEFFAQVVAEDTVNFAPVQEETTVIPAVRNEGILLQGDLYIGLLEIPQLSLTLPIHMDLTMQKLTTAPCVYAGSLAENNLVIAGHNYRSHFWYLKDLSIGAEIKITNPSGKVFRYVVDQKEVIHQSESAVLMDREPWGLSIYTCNYPDNSYRVVVRCVRVS